MKQKASVVQESRSKNIAEMVNEWIRDYPTREIITVTTIQKHDSSTRAEVLIIHQEINPFKK